MELIDKSAIKAEIERRRNEYINSLMTEQVHTLSDILDFLDTLEVKDDVVSNEPIISPELLTASAAYAREQLANPDYPTYNDEYELLCAFEAGAKWQKEQLKDK